MTETEEFASIARLTKDLREAARTLSAQEARFLVDMYYAMQRQRIRAGNQLRAASKSAEPNTFFSWFADQNETLEKRVGSALKYFADAHPVGEWMQSICGIGPVISAGLLAHIDITKCPTAGHIWSFAGLDPTKKWDKATKRPWNAGLKTLCWKIGESFVKVSGRDNDIYGKFYLKRKAEEWEKNKIGAFSDQCGDILKNRQIKVAEYRKWYEGGFSGISNNELGAIVGVPAVNGGGVPMLPPGHIHARAKRYAVKLFLAHMHHVWYEHEYGKEPPLPYPIAALGHAHYIPPPKP